MSSSDGGGTDRTVSSGSREGAPDKSYKRRKTTATCQQTAVPLFEAWGRVSTSGDQNGRVDKLKEEEARYLTNIQKFFPEVAWGKVLDKLKEKPDIENCSNASPFFGDLLREKREREVVLPTVFGILSNRYCDKENKDESYKETNVESIPLQRPAPRKEAHRMTGILKCRLVSKKWNAAIEEIHQNEDAGHYWMDNDFEKAANGQVERIRGFDDFYSESQVVQFLGHFQSTHYSAVGGGRGQVLKKCPFFGRCVLIGFNLLKDENKEVCFDRLMEMFENFGDQIWYFRFSWWCSHSEDDYVDLYLKLKEMVELMPNLKVLRIDSHYGFPSSKHLMQPLEEEIQKNPFPVLTKLKMIRFYETPGALRNYLLNQNQRISRLEIRFVTSLEDNGNCPLFPNKLSNLSHLSLAGVDTQVLDALVRYPFTLNLQRFTLVFVSQYSFVRWSHVLSAIGSKINTDSCTHLNLKMPIPESEADEMSVLLDSKLWRLPLANIQRCQVSSDVPFSLDFLLESKDSLREIELCSKLTGRVGNAEREKFVNYQVIKFMGFEEKMEQSNIGKELPRLKKLKVNECRYCIKANGVVKIEG